jgi:hypothetical protein
MTARTVRTARTARTVRRDRRRPASALAVAALLALALAACGGGDADPRGGDPTTRSTGTTEETQMLTAPEDVLALAGLTLPAGADGATVEQVDRPGYHYAYTVTFEAPADEVAQFAQDVTGSPLDALSVPPAGEPDSLYKDTTIEDVPAGSRYWDGPFSPQDGGYGKLLLLVDGPDLTRAHVGVAAFAS